MHYSCNLGKTVWCSPELEVDKMRNFGVILLFGLVLLLPLTACEKRPFQTLAVYDDSSRFVRLEVDPTVGGSHSQPADITTDEMIAVLSGVMIEEPPLFMRSVPFSTKDEEPRQHQAFNEVEISFFAPLLAKGLRKATSEEIVTFGQASQKSTIIDKVMFVTSGGMFVDGDELHLILSNYRSETNYAPDPGIGDKLDGRSTPLQPIAPQRTKVYFEPATAVAPSQQGILQSLLRPKRQEIILLFKNLRSTTSDVGRKLD